MCSSTLKLLKCALKNLYVILRLKHFKIYQELLVQYVIVHSHLIYDNLPEYFCNCVDLQFQVFDNFLQCEREPRFQNLYTPKHI